MSKRPQLRGSRAAAAVALLALASVAAPAGATASSPDDGCTQADAVAIELSHELLASLDPAPAPAPVLDDVRQALASANVVIARRAARDQALVVRLEQIADSRRAVLNTATIDEIEAIRHIHTAVAFDRDVDHDAAIGEVLWHLETLDRRDEPAGPWEMVADVIVTAAQFPARAGIVVKHLVGAAAKITPRVARSLF